MKKKMLFCVMFIFIVFIKIVKKIRLEIVNNEMDNKNKFEK